MKKLLTLVLSLFMAASLCLTISAATTECYITLEGGDLRYYPVLGASTTEDLSNLYLDDKAEGGGHHNTIYPVGNANATNDDYFNVYWADYDENFNYSTSTDSNNEVKLPQKTADSTFQSGKKYVRVFVIKHSAVTAGFNDEVNGSAWGGGSKNFFSVVNNQYNYVYYSQAFEPWDSTTTLKFPVNSVAVGASKTNRLYRFIQGYGFSMDQDDDNQYFKEGKLIYGYWHTNNIVDNKTIDKLTEKATSLGYDVGTMLDMKYMKNTAYAYNTASEEGGRIVRDFGKEISIEIPLEKSIINTSPYYDRTYSLIMINEDGEAEEITKTKYIEVDESDAWLFNSGLGGWLKITIDKLYPFAIVYKDVRNNTPIPQETEESNSLASVEVKSYDSKDTNQDGVISCEEEMNNANWIWSNTKKACVYKVSNTSTK